MKSTNVILQSRASQDGASPAHDLRDPEVRARANLALKCVAAHEDMTKSILTERDLVGFIHIPKTAGLTFGVITSCIAASMDQTWARFRGTVYGQCFGAPRPEALDTLRAERGKLDSATYATGHVPFGFHSMTARNVRHLTLLRSPVERTISHFNHILRHANAEDSSTWFADVLAAGGVIDNVQVRMLAGCEDARQPCDRGMLEEAKRNLRERIWLCGLTEDFESFLKTVITAFAWPTVVFSNQNTRGQCIALTDARMRIIRDLNRYDLLLYDFAASIVAAKSAAVLEEVRRTGVPVERQSSARSLLCLRQTLHYGGARAVWCELATDGAAAERAACSFRCERY